MNDFSLSLIDCAAKVQSQRAVVPLAEVCREATGPAAVSVAAATNSYTMGGKWLAQLIITDTAEDAPDRDSGEGAVGKKRSAAVLEDQNEAQDVLVKKRYFIGRYDSENDARAVVRLVINILICS
jgi:hypothetical protein